MSWVRVGLKLPGAAGRSLQTGVWLRRVRLNTAVVSCEHVCICVCGCVCVSVWACVCVWCVDEACLCVCVCVCVCMCALTQAFSDQTKKRYRAHIISYFTIRSIN